MSEQSVVSRIAKALANLKDEFIYNCINKIESNYSEYINEIVYNSLFPVLLQYPETNFYRVREGDVSYFYDDNHFYKNDSEFSLNPNKKNIRQGRCNHAEVPVFYCAYEEKTAQYEAIEAFRISGYNEVNVPHIAYIGRWQSARELKVANFSGRNDWMFFFEKNHPEWVNTTKDIVDFISNAYMMPFDNNPAIYSFTASLSEVLLREYDGVIFPSSITQGEGVNAVFDQKIIDNGSLFFCNACRIRRTSYNKGLDRIDNWIGRVISEDGELMWFPSERTLLSALKRQGLTIKEI